MGKVVELPDDVWEKIEQEARARHVDPAELIRESVEKLQASDFNDLLRARGRTRSRPRPGPCQSTPFPRVRTKDGSLVSDRIIKDRA
jgi:hypothetical protein